MAFGVWLVSFQAAAQRHVEADSLDGIFEVVLENDATQDTDRYYSNALHLAYGRFLSDDVFLLGRLGHEIYTPRFLRPFGPLPGDRPYAGWLFVQGELQLREPHAAHGFAARVGVVGPASGAEVFQTWAHRMFAVRRPQGWGSQLENQATVQGEWESAGHYTSPLGGRWSITAVGIAGAEVGNVRLRGIAGAGILLGLGVDPSDAVSFVSEWLSPVRWSHDIGFALFAGGAGRVVLYDLFLDAQPDVERIPVGGELRVGFQFTYEDFRIRYVHVFASPEFRVQPEHHGYGSFRMSIAF